MIVIRVEMHPGGNPKQKYELGCMTLSNLAETTASNPNRGDYAVKVFRKPKRGTFTDGFFMKPALKEGTVLDHPRNSQRIWKLVEKACRAVYP